VPGTLFTGCFKKRLKSSLFNVKISRQLRKCEFRIIIVIHKEETMETAEVAQGLEGDKLYQIRARKALPILVRRRLFTWHLIQYLESGNVLFNT
jgi:hypothetical protein